MRAVDGEGQARWATVETVGRASARLLLEEEAPSNEPQLEVAVLVAAPRIPRAAWLVEKVTEVGVVAVRFFNSERSPRSYGPASLKRLRRVAAAAVEQCHRARIPQISGVHPFAELAELVAGCPERWLLDPDQRGEMSRGDGPVALLVGPEGGWSDGEREILDRLGCRPWSLGTRVLRVETAAIAGSALMLLA